MKEYEYTGKAMGTDYAVAIVTDVPGLADVLAAQTIDEIKLYESIFSRFLPDSELSRLNQQKEIKVLEIFITVTEKAYKLFELTGGIFNPLVQIERLGYNKDFSKITKNQSDIKDNINSNKSDDVEYNIDFSKVIIDKDNSKIILQPGQKIDFGGILKGYLAEILAKKIISNSNKVKGVIVNIGGDIHTEGLDINNQKFVFNIYNPITKADDILVILYNESLATSGTYKRHWKSGEIDVHHILDISGIKNPETDIISASVIHKDGSKTEAFTKVFLTEGEKKALEILKGEDIKFIIIKRDGQIIKNI